MREHPRNAGLLGARSKELSTYPSRPSMPQQAQAPRYHDLGTVVAFGLVALENTESPSARWTARTGLGEQVVTTKTLRRKSTPGSQAITASSLKRRHHRLGSPATWLWRDGSDSLTTAP